MSKIHIEVPVVHPIEEGHYVTVPSASWNELCKMVNSMAQVINAQTDALQTLTSALAEVNAKTSSNTENITKLATIIGDIYETLE